MFSDLGWLGLISWFTFTFVMGNTISSSMNSGRYSEVLRDSKQYSIQPPSVAFSAIWIILYCLNATSVMLIWRTNGSFDIAVWELSLTFYIVQLVLTAVWSPLVFNHRNIKIAVTVIVFALMFALCNMLFFFMQSVLAGCLLIPYITWIVVLIYYTLGMAIGKAPPPGTSILTDGGGQQIYSSTPPGDDGGVNS